jgi:hypothetical protein
MVMNHSSCHDPPSLHPLLPGGVGYHCSAEPKGGNDVSATFACMDTWQPFVGWLPWGELTLRRMAHWGGWFAHGKLMFFRIYVGLQEDICWYVLPKISQTCYWYWFAKMWTGASTISWFLVPMSQVSRCCRPRYCHEIHPPKGVLCIESGGCSPVKFRIEHLETRGKWWSILWMKNLGLYFSDLNCFAWINPVSCGLRNNSWMCIG